MRCEIQYKIINIHIKSIFELESFEKCPTNNAVKMKIRAQTHISFTYFLCLRTFFVFSPLRDFLSSHTIFYFSFDRWTFSQFSECRPMYVEAKLVKTQGWGERRANRSALPPSSLGPILHGDALGFWDKKMSTKTRTLSLRKRASKRSLRTRVYARNSSGAGGGRPVGRLRANVRRQRRRTENALGSASARVRWFRGSGLGLAADGRADGWGVGDWWKERRLWGGEGGRGACRPRPREFLLSVSLSLALSPLTVRHSVSIIFLFFSLRPTKFCAARDVTAAGRRGVDPSSCPLLVPPFAGPSSPPPNNWPPTRVAFRLLFIVSVFFFGRTALFTASAT